jgi:hypothetical protein
MGIDKGFLKTKMSPMVSALQPHIATANSGEANKPFSSTGKKGK